MSIFSLFLHLFYRLLTKGKRLDKEIDFSNSCDVVFFYLFNKPVSSSFVSHVMVLKLIIVRTQDFKTFLNFKKTLRLAISSK